MLHQLASRMGAGTGNRASLPCGTCRGVHVFLYNLWLLARSRGRLCTQKGRWNCQLLLTLVEEVLGAAVYVHLQCQYVRVYALLDACPVLNSTYVCSTWVWYRVSFIGHMPEAGVIGWMSVKLLVEFEEVSMRLYGLLSPCLNLLFNDNCLKKQQL